MEVDNERVVDKDVADEVENLNDLEFLDRWQLGNDNDEEKADEDLDMVDSDDDTYNLANPDTCNTILFCNYVFLFDNRKE